MSLFAFSGIGVVGQGILQPPELLSCVTAKGADRPPGEEQLAPLKKLPPDGGKYKIVIRFTAQQLNGVGVAVDEQGEKLVERVHGSVRLRVHHLFEIVYAKQVCFAVQGTAP